MPNRHLIDEYPLVVDDVFSSDDMYHRGISPRAERFEVWQEACVWTFLNPERAVIGKTFFFKHLNDAIEFKLRFSK